MQKLTHFGNCIVEMTVKKIQNRLHLRSNITMSAIDQKRIAKNTMLLYLRIGVVMLVGLYTSRVVLDALGEVDFGVYNAVGAIVMMFSFLSSTMSTSCQRFYSYEIGRGNFDELRRTFSLCVLVFAIIIVVLALATEVSGIWLLQSKMKVASRMEAARWVFHLSILSFVFTIIRTPYMGMVIAKEKMKVFAYLTVIDVVGGLGIAILIAHYGGDRLILYAILMAAVNAMISAFYIVYCRVFYPECKLMFYWDRERFCEILGFAGWNMVGSISSICKSHGLNILINIFFGPAVNAARGLAYKVFQSIQTFADNFYWAVRPQLIKSYSAGDRSGMLKLVCQSSKFTYYLIFAVALPVLLETPFLLGIWLKKVPDYTILFTRLVVINAVVESLANPLAAAMQAYGKIRNYNLAVGGFILLILPVSYLFLKLGFPPETVFYVSIIICAIAILVRLLFVRKCVGLSLRMYLKSVVLPVLAVTVVATICPVLLETNISYGFIRFVTVVAASILMTGLSVYCIGLTPSERQNVLRFVGEKLHIGKLLANK